MALFSNYYDPEFYTFGENEEEVESELQGATEAAAGGSNSCCNGGAGSFLSAGNQEDDVNQEGNLSSEGNVGPDSDNSKPETTVQELENPAILVPAFPAPRRQRRGRRCREPYFHFTLEQVDEMESIFQETQYPDLLTRAQIARYLDVP